MASSAANEVFFGTPLPDLPDDDDVKSSQPSAEELSRKRKLREQEDYVLDEEGRRRFHGAFTGGFSAGYFNSVGSKEGWQPKAFVSSRQQRTGNIASNPEQYMDDEDLGQFGIAPRSVAVKKSNGIGNSHAKPVGELTHAEAVLMNMLEVRQSTIGERIMLSMGWRVGHGIGPRVSRSVKSSTSPPQEVMQDAKPTAFGCALPPGFVRKNKPLPSSATGHAAGGNQHAQPKSSVDELADDLIVWGLAPDDVEVAEFQPKTNRHGIGYTSSLLPLTESSSLASDLPVSSNTSNVNLFSGERGHINLFGDKLISASKTKPLGDSAEKFAKKQGMRGHAFGVGALEDEHDDVAVYDDDEAMHPSKQPSKYNYSLGPKTKNKAIEAATPILAIESGIRNGAIPGFVPSKHVLLLRPAAATLDAVPEVPADWQPARRTHPPRSSLTNAPEDVAKVDAMAVPSEPTTPGPVPRRSRFLRPDDIAVDSNGTTGTTGIAQKISDLDRMQTTPKSNEKPPPKPTAAAQRQSRWAEKSEIPATVTVTEPKAMVISPAPDIQKPAADDVTMPFTPRPPLVPSSNSFRSQAMLEAMKARFKPARFKDDVRGEHVQEELRTEHTQQHVSSQMRQRAEEAAKRNEFGRLTHRTTIWQASKLLCKRFNVRYETGPSTGADGATKHMR